MLSNVRVGQSEGSKTMRCGSLDVEQSSPTPGHHSTSNRLLFPSGMLLWSSYLTSPLLRLIAFNHISILQHAHRQRGMTTLLVELVKEDCS